VCAQLALWLGQERNYGEYARIMANLLRIQRADFKTAKLKIVDVIAPHAMGKRNDISQLQNYVAGISPAGLTLNAAGELDLDKSLVHVNYCSLLHGLSVRNNVQRQVTNRPVDILATRVPAKLLEPLVHEQNLSPDAVWVYEGNDRQALILAGEDAGGK
jgi:hypothetical protein